MSDRLAQSEPSRRQISARGPTRSGTDPDSRALTLLAGALAHLARHLGTGCPRAAERAALLLERIAENDDAEASLREHAHELIDILERQQSSGNAPLAYLADAPARPSRGWSS